VTCGTIRRALLVGALLAASVNPIAAATDDASSQTASDLAAALTEARRMIDRGAPREAITTLEKLDRDVVEVRHLLGVAYYHADDHKRAIEILAGLRDAFPADSRQRREVVQVLGLCHYLSGHFTDAIPLLEETRQWARDNTELGYILGQAYIQTRQPDAARRALASTFGVPEDSAAAHLIAAQQMIRLEMEPMAEAELKKALGRDPRLPRANYLLGQIALFRGRLDEALTLSLKEIEISPGDGMAWYQLGDAYLRQSRWDDAAAALQKSLWLNPFYSGPYILLGRVYIKKEQPATAEGMLRRAIQYDPNNRTAHYLLAQLLQQTGRLEEARREFEIAERLQAPGR
jgi:cytochrome c-type biogenesis protein CcmH/NrfG